MTDSADQIAVETFCEYLGIKTVQPNPDYATCMKFLEKVPFILSCGLIIIRLL